MVEFKVYDEKEKKEERKTVYLTLKQYGKTVTLQAVDEDGYCVEDGNLLTIYSDGSMSRHGGISSHLRLRLDSEGRLEMDE